MKTIKIKKKKTKMIAHRGLSGLEKENSIPAFIAACNHSYYGSECDIHFTSDKKWVICHDGYTGRVASKNVTISETSFEELSKIKLNEFNSSQESRTMVIPTLIEYLNIHKKYNKHCIIEIKCAINDYEAKELLDIIRPYYKLVTFISFTLENLIIIRNIDNKIPLQLLSGKYDDSLIETCVKYHLGIDILFSELNLQRIQDFHKYNIIVNAWTINDKIVASKLVEDGIDFITTNILE